MQIRRSNNSFALAALQVGVVLFCVKLSFGQSGATSASPEMNIFAPALQFPPILSLAFLCLCLR